jgi:hypothetical protein
MFKFKVYKNLNLVSLRVDGKTYLFDYKKLYLKIFNWNNFERG